MLRQFGATSILSSGLRFILMIGRHHALHDPTMLLVLSGEWYGMDLAVE